MRVEAVAEARRNAARLEAERLAGLAAVDATAAGVDPNAPWEDK